MGLDIALNELDSMSFDIRLENLPELLLSNQLKPFFFVFNDSNFSIRMNMSSESNFVFWFSFIRVKSVVFGFILKIVIGKSMLIARQYWLKVFYMNAYISIQRLNIVRFSRVNENVWNLLFHFRSKSHHNKSLTLCLKQHLSLSILEKTKFRHLQFEKNFMIDCW